MGAVLITCCVDVRSLSCGTGAEVGFWLCCLDTALATASTRRISFSGADVDAVSCVATSDSARVSRPSARPENTVVLWVMVSESERKECERSRSVERSEEKRTEGECRKRGVRGVVGTNVQCGNSGDMCADVGCGGVFSGSREGGAHNMHVCASFQCFVLIQ